MKISIQTGATFSEIGCAKTYELFRKAGVEAVDWNIDGAVKSTDLKNGTYLGSSILERSMDEICAYYAEELTSIKQNGLTITQAHAPFPAYIPGKPDTLDYMIEVYKKCILLCAHAGVQNLVIHGISLHKKDAFDTLESIEKLNWKLYTSLIPTLQQTNVTVCLENLFTTYTTARHEKLAYEGHCSNPYQAVAIIDALNREAGKACFGLCLDTGHLHLLKGDERVYIPMLGKRIKALHINDNDGIDDRHVAPYNGTIIWQDVCDMLAKIGYEGDLSFETFRQTSTACIPEELILSELKTIVDIGVYFRENIKASADRFRETVNA